MAEHHLRAAECHLEQAKNIIWGGALFDLIVVLLINPNAVKIFLRAKHSNMVKDPDKWTTGDETMTAAQRSYLRTLSDEAGEDSTRI